ncbi:MAG: acyl--CoA ligase [Bacilli bacterium]|nr:acyl--CoA ligase [Bacilli bacterium]
MATNIDANIVEKLKRDLKIAIEKKDTEKINEIRQILKISDEQAQYFERGMTGFPSIDRTWIQHFRDGAEQHALDFPTDKTVWDVIESKILEYYDIPALEYFGRVFQREEFREKCYTWARTFRAMGVEPDEIVPVYGPFVPDIAAMTFALNMIGATPYFLKLAISPEALAKETEEAKIAVVFNGMWQNVAGEFTKDKYKSVIIAAATDDMPSPKKQIVSFISMMSSLKSKSKIPDEKKYIWIDKARQIGDYYSGEVKVPFKADRTSFITSSSGTTVGGVVKGVMTTNEKVIAQLYASDSTDVQFFPGDKALSHFPPTASTALNLLYLLPLYRGMTIVMDPRVSEKDFYNQIVSYRPQVAVNTGSMWESFFNRVEREMLQGKKFDFSCAEVWVVGGEGTDVKKFVHWNEIMKACGCNRGMVSGYGTSELFASSNTEKIDARSPLDKPVMGVGVPYAGLTEGVFDENGNELSYNQRGNLWIKGPTVFKGYYGKPELTEKSTENGWFKTGDMAEIDENGFVYVYGRTTDSITVNDNIIYLFDISFLLKETNLVDDAIVLNIPTRDSKFNLVAHIVWNKELENFNEVNAIEELNNVIKNKYGESIKISGYKVHDTMLPYSPTTLKKDKNKMVSEREGYIQVVDKRLSNIDFKSEENENLNNEIKTK